VDGKTAAARRLALLGILLQVLHVLFGITAIAGMVISHTLIHKTQGTPYQSQLRWQLVTFWTCAVLYFAAFVLWRQTGSVWLIVVVFLFAVYRIGVSVYYYLKKRPLGRIL